MWTNIQIKKQFGETHIARSSYQTVQEWFLIKYDFFLYIVLSVNVLGEFLQAIASIYLTLDFMRSFLGTDYSSLIFFGEDEDIEDRTGL